MLTDDERAQTERKTLDDGERHFMRTIIDGFRLSYADESMWVDRLEMALDSADHWKKRAEAAEATRGDDSELAGEVEVLRKDNITLKEAIRDVRHVVEEELTGNINAHSVVAVKQLADSYRAEKERADRLQDELDGMRDVAELHRAKALWGYNPVKDVIVWGSEESVDSLKQVQSDRDRLQTENETLRAARESLEPVGWMLNIGEHRTPLQSHWFGPHVERGTKRRVYLAPPQPLEVSE